MKGPTYGIGLYAPAGFVLEAEAIARATARLQALGHRVIVDPTASTRWQRFSASDDERLAAVMRMASDLSHLHLSRLSVLRLPGDVDAEHE